MILLGIAWSHVATAALMIDGSIVACVSEERLNRIKHFDGWPAEAILECLKIGGVSPQEIDYVVWGSTSGVNPDFFLTNRYCSLSVSDMLKEQHEYWRPLLYENKQIDYLKIFQDKINLDQFPGRKYLEKIIQKETWEGRYAVLQELRYIMVEELLGLPREKNIFLDHHDCHAAYAACAIPSSNEKFLVFTIDGSGDGGENATVSLFEGRGAPKRLYSTTDFLLGRFYRFATLLLKMEWESHEFKVMGLAPYSKPYHSDTAYNIFKDTMYVDDIDIGFKSKPTDSYFWFKKRLEAVRFDGIAGGIQRYLEDTLCQWFSNWMQHTGINNILYSGGVAMNVKANLEVLQRCGVNRFFVPGSGSDESLAIGACFRYCLEHNLQYSPLNDLYLGTEITEGGSRKAVDNFLNDKKEKYSLAENIDEATFAKQVAAGKVIGRCVGKMEFGARSLGNRSIVADPRSEETIRQINDKIKSRDFWMPFAPSILYEQSHKYIATYSDTNYTQMSIGAKSTEEGRKKFPAALHPADKTARPQLVKKELNKRYHSMISEFEKLTGVGGVLNTSLNIHGMPIVRTETEALDLLEQTDIDGMLVDRYLLMKKK